MKRENVFVIFVETAEAVEEIYGLPTIIDEDETSKTFQMPIGYHCPHCGEVVLWEDWEDNYVQYPATITTCPICCEDLEVY